MLSGNTAMSPTDAVLEVRPEALDGVGMRFAVYPLVDRVVHGLVRVAHFLEWSVCSPLVRAHDRTFPHVLFNVREKGLASRVLDNAGDDVTAALNHAEDNGLFRVRARASSAMRIVHGNKLLVAGPTTDKGLIQFDVPRQTGVAVHFRHVLADFMRHAPRAFVGDAQLALQFLGRYTVARGRKQVHGVEPLLQRCAGALKRRARHWVDVMTTPRAGKGWHFLNTGESPMFAALGAVNGLAVAKVH